MNCRHVVRALLPATVLFLLLPAPGPVFAFAASEAGVHGKPAPQRVSKKTDAAGEEAGGAHARVVVGRVIRVIDGDTLELRVGNASNYRVRLAGIDAPERHQPFYRASREALAELTAGVTVRVESYKQDRWGRLVGNVYIDDDDAGLQLVRRGMAWHFRRFAREQTSATRRAYERAEAQARAAGLGLWSAAQPVAPWDFRRNR